MRCNPKPKWKHDKHCLTYHWHQVSLRQWFIWYCRLCDADDTELDTTTCAAVDKIHNSSELWNKFRGKHNAQTSSMLRLKRKCWINIDCCEILMMKFSSGWINPKLHIKKALFLFQELLKMKDGLHITWVGIRFRDAAFDFNDFCWISFAE